MTCLAAHHVNFEQHGPCLQGTYSVLRVTAVDCNNQAAEVCLLKTEFETNSGAHLTLIKIWLSSAVAGLQVHSDHTVPQELASFWGHQNSCLQMTRKP